ncbi:MAG: hypothetical protein U0269_30765 [Polyangiales bacterium]
MNEPPRRRQGLAVLPPEQRSRIAADGGRARRASGAPYSITLDNARAIAALRWRDAVALPAELRDRLLAALDRYTATHVANEARLARSTVCDAAGGGRVTAATTDALRRALATLESEAA